MTARSLSPWRLVPLLALIASPALAQREPVRLAAGYAYLQILEAGGGSVPLGGYLSAITGGESSAVELDLAYHRDNETLFTQTIHLNTITATIGPRVNRATGKTRPYFHVLGGIRYDWLTGGSNTSYGGLVGTGVDVSTGSRMFLRFGADFEIFFNQGDNLKALRLSAGIGL